MIRKTIVDDLNIICQISNHEGLTNNLNDGLAYYDWYFELIQEPKCLFYTYLIENNIVGFIFGEELLSNGFLIWGIGVLPSYINRGVGVKLLKFLENEIKKMGLTWIYTEGFVNTINQKSMKKLGFETNGQLYRLYVKDL